MVLSQSNDHHLLDLGLTTKRPFEAYEKGSRELHRSHRSPRERRTFATVPTDGEAAEALLLISGAPANRATGLALKPAVTGSQVVVETSSGTASPTSTCPPSPQSPSSPPPSAAPPIPAPVSSTPSSATLSTTAATAPSFSTTFATAPIAAAFNAAIVTAAQHTTAVAAAQSAATLACSAVTAAASNKPPTIAAAPVAAAPVAAAAANLGGAIRFALTALKAPLARGAPTPSSGAAACTAMRAGAAADLRSATQPSATLSTTAVTAPSFTLATAPIATAPIAAALTAAQPTTAVAAGTPSRVAWDGGSSGRLTQAESACSTYGRNQPSSAYPAQTYMAPKVTEPHHPVVAMLPAEAQQGGAEARDSQLGTTLPRFAFPKVAQFPFIGSLQGVPPVGMTQVRGAHPPRAAQGAPLQPQRAGHADGAPTLQRALPPPLHVQRPPLVKEAQLPNQAPRATWFQASSVPAVDGRVSLVSAGGATEYPTQPRVAAPQHTTNATIMAPSACNERRCPRDDDAISAPAVPAPSAAPCTDAPGIPTKAPTNGPSAFWSNHASSSAPPKRRAQSEAAAAPPAKKTFTSPFHEFCLEQRPLISTAVNGNSDRRERERLLGQRWKALSGAEKDKYKEGLTPLPASGRGGTRAWARTSTADAPAIAPAYSSRPRVHPRPPAPPSPPTKRATPCATPSAVAVPTTCAVPSSGLLTWPTTAQPAPLALLAPYHAAYVAHGPAMMSLVAPHRWIV